MLPSRRLGCFLGGALVLGSLHVRAQTGAAPPSADFPVEPQPDADPPPDAASSAPEPSPGPLPPPTHAASGTPFAEEPPLVEPAFEPTAELRFARPGQLALSSLLGLSLSSTTHSGSDASSFSVNLHPSFDYFLFENFSLGAFAHFSRRSDKVPYVSVTGSVMFDRLSTAFGGGLRAGYNLPLNELFSSWLTAGVWAGKVRREEPVLSSSSSLDGTTILVPGVIHEGIFGLTVSMPLLIHPAPHFFVGLGPFAEVELVHDIEGHSNRGTEIGFNSIVGGWI